MDRRFQPGGGTTTSVQQDTERHPGHAAEAGTVLPVNFRAGLVKRAGHGTPVCRSPGWVISGRCEMGWGAPRVGMQFGARLPCRPWIPCLPGEAGEQLRLEKSIPEGGLY